MPTENPDNEPDPKPEPTPKPDTDASAEVEKWKALARKHEAQAKANAEAATKLAQLEDAGKSESDKLREELAAAKQVAQDATSRADRLEVALTKALPEGDARRVINGSKRIAGSTREELEADADDYFADFAPAGGGDERRDTPGGRPKERLRGGGDPTDEPEETDPRKLADLIPRT